MKTRSLSPTGRHTGLRTAALVVALYLVVVGLALHPHLALAQSTITSPWITFTRGNGLITNNVWAILADKDAIWFGTDIGISRFDGTWTSYPSGGESFSGQVKVLAYARDLDGIWAGTDTGTVARWGGEAWTKAFVAAGPVQALHEIDGQLWIGTRNGLYRWNGNDLTSVAELEGLSVSAVSGHTGSIYVGTTAGLWVFKEQAWSVVTAQNGLPGDEVTALWIDQDGIAWVGTSLGIAWQNAVSGQWAADRSRPYPVSALIGNNLGTVWAGTVGNGAFKIIDNGALIIPFSGDVGLTTPFVQAVALDQDGSVWFGTAAGVFRYDNTIWISEQRDSVIFPGINNINALLTAEEGTLWIATNGAGIRRKQGAGWATVETVYTSQDSALPGNVVLALAQDSQGAIWAGTTQGVARFWDNQWTLPFSTDQLPSPMVNALLARENTVWIGTGRGLAYYSLSDGRLTVEPVVGESVVQALATDLQDRVWVGTRRAGAFIRDGHGNWSQLSHDLDSVSGLLDNSIVSLAPDLNLPGGMWVAIDEGGVSHWDGQAWTTFTGASGLPSNLVYTVYTDPINHHLWIGSEGGVTRYDGITWETYGERRTLLNTAVYAVARTSKGGYWFGGKDGLTYYHPEQTPPWIRIDAVSGSIAVFDGRSAQAETGQQVTLSFTAGDLHTAQSELKILYRISGPGRLGRWQVVNALLLNLPMFQQAGDYVVELQARDQAFNYSDIAQLALKVVLPPPRIDLPFLGPVRQDYLIALTIIALVGLVGFSYMSNEILQNRRRVREAVSRGYNPYISGEPVRREDMFFGRHELLQRIVDMLHNNSIMIHGERRIGKTSLLYQLTGRLREMHDPEYWFVPLFIDLEGTAQESFFHLLLEEILHGVLTLPEANTLLQPELEDLLYYSTPTEAYTDREFSRDLRVVIKALQRYGEDRHPGKQLRLVLMMDEMDVISSYDRLVQQRLRRIFMREFSATLGAVVAGIQISKEWDRIESPWYNLFNEIELEPFDREQAVELLEQPVRDYYTYDPAAIDFILEHSEGRPFRLQQFGLEAVNTMLADRRRRITLSDVQTAFRHIQANSVDANIGLALPGGGLEGGELSGQRGAEGTTAPEAEGESTES